jgi:hypothetical protein
MKNKKISALFLLSGFMLSCTGSSVSTKTEITPATPSFRIEARKFEEVVLITSTGNVHKGKIVTLSEESIELRPFPYWNVDLVRLQLDDVHSVELSKKGSRVGKGFISGFGWTFVLAGMIGGMSSKYDEDYEAAFLGSATLGAAAGVVGLLVGALQDAATKKHYEFAGMSKEEKKQAIRKVMGLPAR